MANINIVLAIVGAMSEHAVIDEDLTSSFDQLAEEVMELHLALRGKHKDSPAMEWLEIASIAVGALQPLSSEEIELAWRTWRDRHEKE